MRQKNGDILEFYLSCAKGAKKVNRNRVGGGPWPPWPPPWIRYWTYTMIKSLRLAHSIWLKVECSNNSPQVKVEIFLFVAGKFSLSVGISLLLIFQLLPTSWKIRPYHLVLHFCCFGIILPHWIFKMSCVSLTNRLPTRYARCHWEQVT